MQGSPAHWTRRQINSSELAACQLPRVISGKRPTTKPESWYGQPELLKEINLDTRGPWVDEMPLFI